MQKGRNSRDGRAGKIFLNVEINPRLRERMRLAARYEGKTLKEWLPIFLEEHLPNLKITAVPR